MEQRRATTADPASVAPGPELAALLDAVPPGDLRTAALVDLISGLERLSAWVSACQAEAIAEFACRRLDVVSDEELVTDSAEAVRLSQVNEFAEDELSAALSISRMSARSRIDFALNLTGRLPETLRALREGRIGVATARVVVDGTGALSDQVASAVEATVVPWSEGRTPGAVRAAVTRSAIAADPAAAETRHVAAVATRRVELFTEPDGMAAVRAVLRADDALAVMDSLRTTAQTGATPGDGRTQSQRMADLFVDAFRDLGSGILLDAGTAPLTSVEGDVPATTGYDPRGCAGGTDAGRARRRRGGPAIQVVLAAGTGLGLDDLPGELAGYGPIPASLARELAEDPDSTWRRVLTDPQSGALLDVGRTSYRPPAALADHVRARDRRCRFPGCRQPAQRCDIDHVIRFPDGTTSSCNLCCECRHHHRLKHDSGWLLEAHPDLRDTVTWVAPTGHRYLDTPDPPLTPT
ncbi:MAG TPA: DUF222 domain-containing protein [Mycobacteriales bacterium]|jgi:hypothetical protein